MIKKINISFSALCAFLIALTLALGVMVPAGHAAPAQQKNIILATTTSTQDSGLLDVLIPIFEKKTTLLSSELFKVALHGSADERIIGAFDSVMRKNIIKDEVILPISNWGSSSGFDMMSGFYLLMKANQP